MEEQDTVAILTKSLNILDPLLQLFTKATGKTTVPLPMLCSAVPESNWDSLEHIPELVQRGILSLDYHHKYFQQDPLSQNNWKQILLSFKNKETSLNHDKVFIGFPPPFLHQKGQSSSSSRVKSNLHASTKTAAKKRMAALKKSLKSIGCMITRTNGRQIDDDEQGNTKLKTDEKNQAIDQLQTDDSYITKNQLASKPIPNPHKSTQDGLIDRNEYKEYSVSCQYNRQQKYHSIVQSDSEEYQLQSNAAFRVLNKLFSNPPSKSKRIDTKICDDIDKSPNRLKKNADNPVDHFQILEGQASYAGTNPARELRHGNLSTNHTKMIPQTLCGALGLDLIGPKSPSNTRDRHGYNPKRRHLYYHQAVAIESIMNGVHTLVCTGTGSGKSLCFLLPVLAQVMNSDMKSSIKNSTNNSKVALIMFPTKALAQDQLTKLKTIVNSHPELETHIRPGVIDGDTPHQNRDEIAKHCNVILTNPDTLHAALLPAWKKTTYKSFLQRVSFVCLDELHIYDGAFGAHVSLVLTRLIRIIYCCSSGPSSQRTFPIFVGCSATIGHPEDHFRLLCPLSPHDQVFILGSEDDGSPCAEKHYFVWNPPLLDIQGDSIGQITPSRHSKQHISTELTVQNSQRRRLKKKRKNFYEHSMKGRTEAEIFAAAGLMELAEFQDLEPFHQNTPGNIGSQEENDPSDTSTNVFTRRRHAADETAILLAEAMKRNIRCIAFCKTRMLVEWVYEKCVAILKSEPHTEQLIAKVDSYRGGYSADVRRGIEHRLFQNELLAVVGTSALELGVDIGGIDLTLHCGYPGSISSLLQQSGRAGRGGKTSTPSCAIMVCFSSPSEQYIWKNPKGLMSRGLCAPPSLPLNVGIVQGHLLCAGKEFPLTGDHPITIILNTNDACMKSNEKDNQYNSLLSDSDLFGSKEVYDECIRRLMVRGSLRNEYLNVMNQEEKTTRLQVFKTHPFIEKPWSRVSLRAIEPINYSIVDTSHPMQGGKINGIHDKAAVMDIIPYSRVFYHAYPGAIIMHRGQRYKIHSMSSPPPFVDCSAQSYNTNSSSLGAFAKPTNARYSTRALSITLITIVKQLERVEIFEKRIINEDKKMQDSDTSFDKETYDQFKPALTYGSIAGSGIVNVKRTVHGYKKLSLVNRMELSRTEISLPPMEYDTNAIWFDTEALALRELMTDYDSGVHALSHAIVAVAPLFVPCTTSDLDCDHCHYGCTKILFFDVRAGGAGTSSQLWFHFFRPGGILESAIELLDDCPSCIDIKGYDGGCPGCLQAVPCVNFHQDISRKDGLIIAKRLLARIKQSDLYKIHSCNSSLSLNDSSIRDDVGAEHENKNKNGKSKLSPGSHNRSRALREATDLVLAQKRSILIGRPTWPTDEATGGQIFTDDHDDDKIRGVYSRNEAGGFVMN